MNPSYNGYGDASNLGSMVSPTGTVGLGSQLGNPGQQHKQQHYIGFSLPPAVTESPLSQSHSAGMPNSNMIHHNASSSIVRTHVGNHGYSWNGSELLFLPSSDVTADNLSLTSGLSMLSSGQQSASDMSPYVVKNLPHPYQQKQEPFIPNGVALRSTLGNLQTPVGTGEILSLSLSRQQPSVTQLQAFPCQHGDLSASRLPISSAAAVDNCKGDRFPYNRSAGSLTDFIASSREIIMKTGFQSQVRGAESNFQANIMSSGPMIAIYNSKYLKAVQLLLNEVVSVGRGMKSSSSKGTKLQPWMAHSSINDGSIDKVKNLPEYDAKDGASRVSWTGLKKRGIAVTVLQGSAETDHNAEDFFKLTSAQMQDLQIKKAKLIVIHDEVHRMYQWYYHQMQNVVMNFESAVGLGAARTYSSLALQAISRHFRCLKDAISGQMGAVSSALGEEMNSSYGREQTSRVHVFGQQLCQQAVLPQMGMMQQHSWRPQRGLPERAVSLLRAWLFEHFLHPYPKDSDKHMLARKTGLTHGQVSNWFINARVRLWKPMVEEMYVEEMREGWMEDADKFPWDDGETMSKGSAMDGARNSEMSQVPKQAKLSDREDGGFPEPKSTEDHAFGMQQRINFTGSSSECLLVKEKDIMKQIAKKARNGGQDSASLFSQNSNVDMDFVNTTDGEEILDHDVITRTGDSHRKKYSAPHRDLVQAEYHNIQCYGSFQSSGMNSYSKENFAAMYAAKSGVSLTLGLQHSKGPSLSVAQQQVQGQG